MISQISYLETPVLELFSPELDKAAIRLLVKREDLNHPHVSGNKWWKLSPSLDEAIRLGHEVILTFGGAYSNHIHATAAASRAAGIRSIGIIRGERVTPLNPTLSFAEECGMELHFVTRAAYSLKNTAPFFNNLKERFGDFYLIPEGGTNELAVQSVAAFGLKLMNEVEFDVACLPVGTGGTLAGLIRAFQDEREVMGFSTLKGADFLGQEVDRLLAGKICNRWSIEVAYHFGGYGKTTQELRDFILNQKLHHNLPLDPVYTGKMMFGIWDLIRKEIFPRGTTLLAIHTGGLQGGPSAK